MNPTLINNVEFFKKVNHLSVVLDKIKGVV